MLSDVKIRGGGVGKDGRLKWPLGCLVSVIIRKWRDTNVHQDSIANKTFKAISCACECWYCCGHIWELFLFPFLSALVPIPAMTRTNVRTVFLGTSVPHVLMGTEGMLRQASGWRMRRTPNKFVKRLMSVKRESAAVILMRNALTLMWVYLFVCFLV